MPAGAVGREAQPPDKDAAGDGRVAERRARRLVEEGDDAEEAVRLHAAMTGAAEKLSASEERWLALQEELGSFE